MGELIAAARISSSMPMSVFYFIVLCQSTRIEEIIEEITLSTLEQAASALGKELRIELA